MPGCLSGLKGGAVKTQGPLAGYASCIFALLALGVFIPGVFYLRPWTEVFPGTFALVSLLAGLGAKGGLENFSSL